jgi:hypothetical protein
MLLFLLLVDEAELVEDASSASLETEELDMAKSRKIKRNDWIINGTWPIQARKRESRLWLGGSRAAGEVVMMVMREEQGGEGSDKELIAL